MSKGYESLIKKVKKDCDEGQGCFNPDGCDYEFYKYEPAEGEDKKYVNTVCRHNSKCGHKYCDKFKWIIDRAKHYAEKTGLRWEDILDSWEESCDYWYMNYYQDCNQPLIEGDNVKVFDTVDDLLNSIGEKKFRCPSCGGISTNPYECNSGLKISKETKNKAAKICDWKVYGLFGGLGNDTYVFIKDRMVGERIFTPIAWENDDLIKENHIKGNDKVVIKVPGVEEWTLTQLRNCCKKNKVKGYTKMNRDELIIAVKEVLKNLKESK